MIKYILTCLYIVITTSGLFLLKKGGNSFAISLKDGFAFKIGGITLLGFLCYIVSFILWQKLVVTFDLTYIVPITTGICQILILIIGVFLFHENVNLMGIIGCITVIIGITLIAYSK